VKRESQRRLGGYVDPVAAANFVPFVSSRHVRASWNVAEQRHLDSARELAIDREGTIGAALRESNVLTSSVYEPAEQDGFFVFFTDGEWPLRPLLGAANLVAALGRSGVGVLQLPFDRGRGFARSRGVLSAPELFFSSTSAGHQRIPAAGSARRRWRSRLAAALGADQGRSPRCVQMAVRAAAEASPSASGPLSARAKADAAARADGQHGDLPVPRPRARRMRRSSPPARRAAEGTSAGGTSPKTLASPVGNNTASVGPGSAAHRP
jgi:hypothetical protein